MNKLYEILEICLSEVEQGVDMDTVLLRYPDLADELRPIIATAQKSKAMSVPQPSSEVIQRNRIKLMEHAIAMRKAEAGLTRRRVWSVPLRRALVAIVVIALLFVSGTGLVRAASTTLPGDNLYPVKRTWENVLVLFTFDANRREALELEHENERLEELHELFAEGRSAEVDFAGYVTHRSGDEWRVSGISVFTSSQTRLPDEQVDVGAAVRVRGHVQNDMSILAERIELLPFGSKLPEVEDNEFEIEEEGHEGSDLKNEVNSSLGSEGEAPVIIKETTPSKETRSEDKSIVGIVTSIDGKLVMVNGILIDIRSAKVEGSLIEGASVKVEGYYDSSGMFIATKIETKDNNSGEESESKSTSDGHEDEVHYDATDEPDEPDQPDEPDEHQ